MATPSKKTYLEAMEASPAIRIAGKPKFSLEVDESLAYKSAKFFSDMIGEVQQKNVELSKEHRLMEEAAHIEATMSDELKKLKQKEYVERKKRQQLRNDCEELRALAEHLRLASITKELNEQFTNINKGRQLAKHVQELGFKRAEAERQKQLAKELEEESYKKARQEELRKTLFSQIEDTRRRRQEHYVQTAAERDERIAMQRKIEEEDKAEQWERERAKSKKLTEMLEVMEQQKAIKHLQKVQQEEEIAHALAKQSQLAEKKREMEEMKQKAQREQQEISLRIGNQVLEIENRKRQRDNLLLDLLQAEYKAKDDERYRKQLEQEQLERQRARQELERYRAEMMERNMEQARLRHKQNVERIYDDTVNDELMEKAKQERQRRKEHGALLLSMIKDNNRKRAEEAAEHVLFFSEKAKSEAELQARIQEERRQMLGSVPASVLQYLPKQVLSHSDREYFNI